MYCNIVIFVYIDKASIPTVYIVYYFSPLYYIVILTTSIVSSVITIFLIIYISSILKLPFLL